MLKMVTLFSVVAALAVGCGGSDDKEEAMNPSTGNTTGGTNGTATSGGTNGTASSGGTSGGSTGTSTGGTTGSDTDAGGFVCPRDRIPATLEMFTGTLTMTQTQYMACQTKCMNDQACYTEANCPGIDAFNDCLGTNLFACTAGAGKTCRTPYEDAVCCVTEAGCSETDATCPMTNCPTEITAFQDCALADDACFQTAGTSCLLPGRIVGGSELAGELQFNARALLPALKTLQH